MFGPAWASLRFFRAPSGVPRRLRLLYAAGVPCAAGLAWGFVRRGALRGPEASLSAASFLAAIALFGWAIQSHRRRPVSLAWSDDLPRHLMEAGPYRWVRHPIYTSYILSWVGAAAAAGSAWAWAAPVGMAWLYASAARFEERKFARSALAESYRRYRERTGMFVPRSLTRRTLAQRIASRPVPPRA